ncbi:MAG: tRNA uridine(34) 5-carboxymethylaminomethyl modification radical SAM/GNAT enzyme Elp3 [Candidatus ainarchaeum sp.]|nr:tRNA uridine(34) 5-carboxymethylaminomethyl modification radical SAM/GNAT enzyme Elp3 [Candidatus ainarchaeum sp.]
MKRREAAKAAAGLVLSGRAGSREKLFRIKRELGEKFALEAVLKNSEILECIPEGKRTQELVALLRKRRVRTISGVSPVAIMCNAGCPHGRCAYCPRGENAAQSYTGKEPAALRAIQNGYDAFEQVKARISQLDAIGHKTEKIELIVMGGTFNAQPREAQEFFVKRALDAMNGFESATLAEALKRNESARHRAVGITFEVRPDWCKPSHVDGLLSMGATRVEIGVQTLSDEVMRKVKRGHTVADVAEATRALKDSALKVLYHMMPGLLSTGEEDVRAFRQLFSDDRFKPDMLKIYPFLVMPGTEMHEWWKRGEIAPYSAEEAARVVAEASMSIPRWCRVMRMQRDIPVHLIAAGIKKSNLRELVDAEMARAGAKCECIRCRELGVKMLKEKIRPDWESVRLNRVEYGASGGKEVFLSFDEEAHDALVGFVRLRIPGAPHRPEITGETALVRELHVYGEALGIGDKAGAGPELQHRGFGERLLARAEEIAREEFGKRKVAVMAGTGVKEYYRRLGYSDDGAYVSKKI